MTEWFNQSIDELHAQLVSGAITAEQLTTAVFDRIEETDEQLKAFLALNKEQALAKARAIDEKGIDPDNVLSGIPMALKDNIITKDLRTTAASKMLYNFDPIYNATVADKLEAADTILIGKTNMDEFAMGSSTETSHFQKTTNAWNHDYVPGGSSGGSAAAVAAGQIPFALGSDTGGSVRQPASFNGVVGMKPTFGRVSRYGLIAFSSSCDQIGAITKTVKDNAHVLNVICGEDDKDYTSARIDVPDFTAKIGNSIAGMKIAYPKEYLSDGIDAKVRQSVEQAIEVFKSLGATVEEVSLPHSKYGLPVYYIQACAEATSNLSRFDGIRYGYRSDNVKNLEELYVNTRSEGFGDEVKRRIMLGTFALSSENFDTHFTKAGQVRTLIKQDFEKVFQDYDVIIAPTTPTPAFKFGDVQDPVSMYMCDMLTIPVNLAGLPGMTVPCGFSDGMPLGLQFIGKPFDESTLYQVAYAYEQEAKQEKTPAIREGKAE